MIEDLDLEALVEIDRTPGAFGGLFQITELAVEAGNREPVASVHAKGFGTVMKKAQGFPDTRGPPDMDRTQQPDVEVFGVETDRTARDLGPRFETLHALEDAKSHRNDRWVCPLYWFNLVEFRPGFIDHAEVEKTFRDCEMFGPLHPRDQPSPGPPSMPGCFSDQKKAFSRTSITHELIPGSLLSREPATLSVSILCSSTNFCRTSAGSE